jgi:hypothetical protein
MTEEDRLKTVGTMVVEMLKELPPLEPVWAIIGRRFTADEMINLIENGTDEGRQYVIDTMRVARDVIAHASKRARV